ncbi:hypothetical protein RvY_15025 [Ramazzottius varieornatus]|uniref:Uncharacterized protein n=1 Tax=Ramazzottius varieornatus TaxID=947166 RepID=A0A1D1VUT7_RAMVA|nr:hypothetical protein RvY_15025 [Ramazzottius varieornatus]
MEYFLKCWLILSVSAGLWAKTSGQFFGFPFFSLWPNPLAFWAAGGAGVGAQIPDIGLAGNQDDIRQFWPSFRSLQERAETKPVNNTAAAITNSTAAAITNSTAAAITNSTAAAISPAVADLPDRKSAKVAGNATASSSTNSTSDDTAKAPSKPRSIANNAAGNALSLPAPDQRPLSVVQQRQVLSSSLTALDQGAESTAKPKVAEAETAVTKLISKRPRKRTTAKEKPSKAVESFSTTF